MSKVTSYGRDEDVGTPQKVYLDILNVTSLYPGNTNKEIKPHFSGQWHKGSQGHNMCHSLIFLVIPTILSPSVHDVRGGGRVTFLSGQDQQMMTLNKLRFSSNNILVLLFFFF